MKFFIFLLTNPTFSTLKGIVHVLSFHLKCISPLKLKILKIMNFFTTISIEICCPLATKIRDLKMFKMAFQVLFSAKNVPRFSFRLLVAPKPQKKGLRKVRKLVSTVECLIRKDRISKIPDFHKSNLKLSPLVSSIP